jgi:hypothetical protein
MKCLHCGQDKPVDTKERYTGAFPYGLQASPGHPRESIKQYDEISTICTIEMRYKAGDSFRAIAKWLDGIGVTTRKGTRWHHSQIKRILERRGLL